jgi:antibiotic biosynthesis monooxygenase (ABM) superfamily enzyme
VLDSNIVEQDADVHNWLRDADVHNWLRAFLDDEADPTQCPFYRIVLMTLALYRIVLMTLVSV